MNGDKLLIKTLEKLMLSAPSLTILEKIEDAAKRIGINKKELMNLYVKVKNKIHRNLFEKIPYSDRILLLPQCLRSRRCKAKLTEFGYECIACGECRIPEIKKLAEMLGYRVFIIPGSSIIEKIFKILKPKASVGVACEKELILGCVICEKVGIPGQGVPLLKDGCIETKVDWSEVKKTIELVSKQGKQIKC